MLGNFNCENPLEFSIKINTEDKYWRESKFYLMLGQLVQFSTVAKMDI